MTSTQSTVQAINLASQLDSYTNDARAALLNTKDNAVKVAAYCFMVLQSCKANAGEAWLQAKVDAFNTRVQAHNAPINQRKDDAKSFNDSGTVPGHFAFGTQNSPEEAAEIALALADLQLDAAQKPEYWTELLQQEITSTKGSKRISAIVRVVLDIREKKHSAHVSRYSRAVTWLAQEFYEKTPTLQNVLTKLQDMGGLEEVLLQDINSSDGAVFSQADRKNIAEKNEERLSAAVAQVVPKAVVPMEAKHGFEDKVVLLGRKVEDGIAVLGELAMGESEVKRAMRRFDHPGLLPANAMAEFLARVLQIGMLIEETVTFEVEDDGRRRDDVKTERKVSMRPGTDGRPQLVVSTRYGDVSMVLHATPRSEDINMGPVSDLLLLKRSYRQRLRTLVEDHIHRRFLEIEATDRPLRANGKPATSKLGWKITNTALEASSDNAETWIYWSTPEASSHLPLDVMPLKDDGHVRVNIGSLGDAYDNWAKKLVRPEAPAKSAGRANSKNIQKFVVSMSFSQHGITLRERDPEKNWLIPVTGSLKRGMHLQFVPRDIQAVFAMLLKQPASLFELQPDETGVLAISWMDELAQYRLFVPTCRNDQSRTDRMLIQMQPMSPSTEPMGEAEVDKAPSASDQAEERLPPEYDIEACRL